MRGKTYGSIADKSLDELVNGHGLKPATVRVVLTCLSRANAKLVARFYGTSLEDVTGLSYAQVKRALAEADAHDYIAWRNGHREIRLNRKHFTRGTVDSELSETSTAAERITATADRDAQRATVPAPARQEPKREAPADDRRVAAHMHGADAQIASLSRPPRQSRAEAELCDRCREQPGRVPTDDGGRLCYTCDDAMAKAGAE
jgi:hypothetical protein